MKTKRKKKKMTNWKVMKQVKNSDSHSSFIEASFVVFFFLFFTVSFHVLIIFLVS